VRRRYARGTGWSLDLLTPYKNLFASQLLCLVLTASQPRVMAPNKVRSHLRYLATNPTYSAQMNPMTHKKMLDMLYEAENRNPSRDYAVLPQRLKAQTLMRSDNAIRLPGTDRGSPPDAWSCAFYPQRRRLRQSRQPAKACLITSPPSMLTRRRPMLSCLVQRRTTKVANFKTRKRPERSRCQEKRKTGRPARAPTQATRKRNRRSS
jgi:hypothetical protein